MSLEEGLNHALSLLSPWRRGAGRLLALYRLGGRRLRSSRGPAAAHVRADSAARSTTRFAGATPSFGAVAVP